MLLLVKCYAYWPRCQKDYLDNSIGIDGLVLGSLGGPRFKIQPRRIEFNMKGLTLLPFHSTPSGYLVTTNWTKLRFEPGSEQYGCLCRLPSYCSKHSATSHNVNQLARAFIPVLESLLCLTHFCLVRKKKGLKLKEQKILPLEKKMTKTFCKETRLVTTDIFKVD